VRFGHLARLVFVSVVIAGPAWAAGNDLILVKARIVFRDPDEQQPKWECPKGDDPKLETICLFGPVSFTVDVRDVLIGRNLPRRFHAILSIDPEPSHAADLYLIGSRSPAGEISVGQWGFFAYAGCPVGLGGLSPDFDIEQEVVDLRRAGRLPCTGN
jgi:hypothetical protein